MVEMNRLDEDLQGTPVDATLYHGMIGSLMYLTYSRPELIYAVSICARLKASPLKRECDLLPITTNNLRIVLSGVKPSSEWLPVWESATRSPTPFVMSNNDLQTELEYFDKDYDGEREMEPRPELTKAATPPLRVASLRIRRRGERIMGFEGAQSRGESRVERNTKWGRPSEEPPRGNGGQSVNLPPLLAAYLGRGKNGKPLQSSLTSAYGGHALPNNIGGNIPSNDTFLSHYAQPFIPASLRRRIPPAPTTLALALAIDGSREPKADANR
ncbi:hypothetical protein Tco_1022651 [Tanacetum coccineum]